MLVSIPVSLLQKTRSGLVQSVRRPERYHGELLGPFCPHAGVWTSRLYRTRRRSLLQGQSVDNAHFEARNIPPYLNCSYYVKSIPVSSLYMFWHRT